MINEAVASMIQQNAQREGRRVRILVTGSRDWSNCQLLEHTLIMYASWAGNFQLVVGDCPTGADAMATDWAIRYDKPTPEVHNADWAAYGKRAGPLRNQTMVDSKPDVCIAFFEPGAKNRGTADCVERARRAGIPRDIHDGA